MAVEGEKRGRVNVEYARVDRARGLSIAKIARKQGVTESAIYYALNKHKRRTSTPLGRQRSFYLRDEIVAPIAAHARKYNTSQSQILTLILEGEIPLPARLAQLIEGPLRSSAQLWDGDEAKPS